MIPAIAQAMRTAYHNKKTVQEISNLYGYSEQTVEKTLFPQKGQQIAPKVVSIMTNPNKFPTKKELKIRNDNYDKWAEAGRKSWRTRRAKEQQGTTNVVIKAQVKREEPIVTYVVEEKPLSRAEKMIREGMEYISFGQDLVQQGLKLLKNE